MARLSEDEAVELALAQSKIAAWLDRYPPDPATDADFRSQTRTWLVKVWSGEAGQIAQAVVEDTTSRVTEAWTGPQVAWKMARGRDGAFGGKTLLKPYVWLGLCAIFLLGLADLRRPLSARNLDLLALLGFTASLYFFARGEVFRSAPLVYPVLGYLLARGLWVGFGRRSAPLASVWPTWVLAAAAVFLIGFRVGLNVEAPRGVIDVGLAGVVVPQNPGNLSAFGLLTVDVRNDYVQTHVERHTSLDLRTVEDILGRLTERAAAALDAEGFERADHGYAQLAAAEA